MGQQVGTPGARGHAGRQHATAAGTGLRHLDRPLEDGALHRGPRPQNWRWNYNTGGGQLMDWIGHHCDIAHWGLGFDNTGPSEIEGHGDFPPADAVWNTCTKYRIELKYPEDIHMTIAGGYADIRSGTKWIGTDGWVWVDRGGFDASNQDWKDYKQLPEELRKVKLYHLTEPPRAISSTASSRASPPSRRSKPRIIPPFPAIWA